ncbi:MAG TPA: flagellar basal body protein [Stellaceae bacterium]|nr:flagellar basal body protein [Stellaceae bacterium]
MDLTQIPLFKAMAKKLAWLGARQTVLAENVANASTVGFQGSDLKPLDFRTVLAGKTGALEMAPASSGVSASPLPGKNPNGFERTAPSGKVQLESEIMKVSQTTSDYAFMTSLYQKQLAMLKTALGRGT